MATTSTRNNALNGLATDPDASIAPQSRRRHPFKEAVSLIGNGGLGNPSPDPRPASEAPTSDVKEAIAFYELQYTPSYPRSLAGIALRSFVLGLVLCLSIVITVFLLVQKNPLWRAPFFVSTLAAFHFLEFYTTALSNSSNAKISSFLLSSNGSAYTIAHTAAFTECVLSHLFFPRAYLPSALRYALLLSGLGLVTIGQFVRSYSMYQAGANFSHLVAHTKLQTHNLVTNGMYDYFRHPSYFGFFWWGIGTQLVSGNSLCLLGYAVVLWKFFSTRIKGEEELLVNFFGEEYVEYRQKTWVGIPFI